MFTPKHWHRHNSNPIFTKLQLSTQCKANKKMQIRFLQQMKLKNIWTKSTEQNENKKHLWRFSLWWFFMRIWFLKSFSLAFSTYSKHEEDTDKLNTTEKTEMQEKVISWKIKNKKAWQLLTLSNKDEVRVPLSNELGDHPSSGSSGTGEGGLAGI